MEIPFSHRQSDHESTKKKKYKMVRVIGRDLFARHDSKQWKKNQRKERGHGDGRSFANPPASHERGDRQEALPRRSHPCGQGHEQDD